MKKTNNKIENYRKYIVTGIQYDTDGIKVKLPKKLEIIVPEHCNSYDEIEQYISDEISNITGFCHLGYCVTPEIPNMNY